MSETTRDRPGNEEQLRADIEGTRTEVRRDVEAIKDKLTAGHAATVARHKIGELASAGVDEVRGGIATAVERVRDAGAQAFGTARSNPVPIAMIGLGFGWLLMTESSRRSSRASRAAWTGSRMNREAPDRPAEGSDEPVLGATLRETSQQVGEAAQEQWQRASGAVRRLLREQPLAVGAACVAVGATLGFLVPPSARERRLLGGSRDRLFTEASAVAREARDAAREMASEVSQDARRSARDFAESAERRVHAAADRHGLG